MHCVKNGATLGQGIVSPPILCIGCGLFIRHQILIKATSLGLKESSSRGTKRRRDTESQASSDRPPPTAPTPVTENSIPTPTLISAPPPPQSAAPVQQNTHPPAPPSQTAPPSSVQPSA